MINKRVAVSVSSLVALAIGGAYMAGRAMAGGISSSEPMAYSGVLTDPSGTPLTGTKNVQIQFWDKDQSGALLCTAGPTPVVLAAGAFQVPLPDECTVQIHAYPDVYVQVQVDSTVLGRRKLGAVPYAVEADSVGGKTAAELQNYGNLTNRPAQCSAGQYLDGNGTCHGETDPKVKPTTTSVIPRWTGTTLADGTMTDDGSHVMAGVSAAQASAKVSISNKATAADLGLFVEGGGGTVYPSGYGRGIRALGYYAGEFQSTGSGSSGYGVNATGHIAVAGSSSTSGGRGVYGSTSASDGIGIYGSAPTGASAYAGYFSGNVTVTGSFTVGGTKSAVVDTPAGKTLVYNQESTEVWLEDFGEARLHDGSATVPFDARFLETVTIDAENPCRVFVTANADTRPLYVEKSPQGFRVIESGHGRSNATFDYRVVGKRRGYEKLRLEPGR